MLKVGKITSKIFYISLIFFGLILQNAELYAQNTRARIQNTRNRFEEGKLYIQYDINDAEPNEYFTIWVEITTSKGVKINAKSLTGDVGDGILGGKDKLIIWDKEQDNMFFKDEYYVKVKGKPDLTKTKNQTIVDNSSTELRQKQLADSIKQLQAERLQQEKELLEKQKKEKELLEKQKKEKELLEKQKKEKEMKERQDNLAKNKTTPKKEPAQNTNLQQTNLTNLLLLSTGFPGLGLHKIEKGKPYWLLGAAGYTCLVSSIAMNNRAVKDYDNYLKSNDALERDVYFGNAKDRYQRAKVFAVTAVGLWIVDYAWLFIKTSEIQSVGYRNNSLDKVNMYCSFDPISTKPMLSFRLSF